MRLFTSGIELQTLTAEVEFDAVVGAGGLSIDTTTKRSGAASLAVSGFSSGAASAVGHRVTASSNGFVDGVSCFFRGYLCITTLPSGLNSIAGVCVSEALTDLQHTIRLDSDGTLELWADQGGAAAQSLVAAGSIVLSAGTGTWHRIEGFLKRDGTSPGAGADSYEIRVDGVTDMSGSTASFTSQIRRTVAWGANLSQEAQTTGSWRWDDFAVNDSAGTAQNSWPGAGSVAHIRPNATGEFSQTITLTGSIPAATAWEALDELPISDSVDQVSMITNCTGWAAAGSRFMVNMQPGSLAGIGASDAITLVAIGARGGNNDASGSAWIIGIQTSNGGTKAETAAIQIFGVGLIYTHARAQPRAPFTNYTDPDGAAWTPATVDSLQIGQRASDATPDYNVMAMWAIVEYVPAAVGGRTTKNTRSHPLGVRSGMGFRKAAA